MAQARRFVRDVLASWGADAAADDVVLLTSELVTNAIMHSGTETEVACALLPDAVQVEVVDHYPTRWLPPPPEQVGQDRENGRGLQLTTAIALSWGVEYTAQTKRVWFRVPAAGVAPAAGGSPAAEQPVPIEDETVPSPATLVRLELDDLLQRTAEWARDAVVGDGAYVLLATDIENELELRATTGLDGSLPRYARLTVDEGVAGRLASSLMPAVHDDITQGSGSQAWLLESGARSLVTVPLLAEGRLIGAIGVTSGRVGKFTNDDGARLQRAADQVALPVQSARLTEIERNRRGWLSYLAEASDLLAGTLELEMTLALVAQLVVPRLAGWCGIYLLDESGTPHPAYAWHADENRLEGLRQLLAKVPAPEPAPDSLPRAWLPADGLSLDGLEAAADLAAHTAYVVPLLARGRPIGALALGRSGREPLRREILDLASDLSRRAALALDNARLYEERTATSTALQQSLLPPGLPELRGLDIGVVYEAAGSGNEVGGDFYDVFTLGGDAYAFAVGDVCGKGPTAAAVTGLARHALRLLGRRGDGLREVLAHLNTAILDEGDRSRFVTVVYGVGSPRPEGGQRLRFISAGHPLPMLLRADGTVGPVGTSGDLLGVFTQPATQVCQVDLDPGESLVCFTDGVTERRDGGRMLGEEGVATALTTAAGLPAQAVARRLQGVVTDFAAVPPRDDLAILVLRAV